MTAKQRPLSLQSPDGSYYVTLTDGAGNLAPASGGGGGGNPNGQATMANSAPVVIASDQSAVPVSLTSTTITGTVAATQSGTWTVQPGNTANTTAWKVDGSAVTQPVSAVSLPLPTGASTAAGLTTINTTLGTPFQAGANIGNTSFAATQATAASLNATVVGTGTFATQLTGATNNINNISGTVSLPAGAATSANQTTMATNQTVLQAPVAAGTATATKAELIAGQYNASTATWTDGQQGSIQLDSRGSLRIGPPSSGGATVTITSGSFDTVSTATNWLASGAFGYLYNGSTWDRVRGDATGGLWVGDEARTTNKTATSNAGNVRPIATTVGAAVNKPFQVPELDWTYAAAAGGITNTTTAVTIISAAGAGIRNYLTGLQISNSTLGAGTEFAIRDGAGGTVLWRGILATAASDPGAISFPTPLRGTANTLMEVVTLTASVTGAVYFNAQGYQAP